MGEQVAIISGIVSICGTVIALVYHAGRTSKRIDGHGSALQKHDQRIAKIEDTGHTKDVQSENRLTAIETTVKGISETVKEIRDDVKTINRCEK